MDVAAQLSLFDDIVQEPTCDLASERKEKPPRVIMGHRNTHFVSLPYYRRLQARNARVRNLRLRWTRENGAGCIVCGWSAPSVFPVYTSGTVHRTLISFHHINGFAEGGDEDPHNLLPLCPTCHAAADILPRVIPIRDGSERRELLLMHLRLIAANTSEWTRQYQAWALQEKRKAVESLAARGTARKIQMSLFVPDLSILYADESA